MTKVRDEQLLIDFGVNLRKLRHTTGYSMEQLADLAKVEYRQVADIELGKINTTISTASALAKALEVPLKDLFNF